MNLKEKKKTRKKNRKKEMENFLQKEKNEKKCIYIHFAIVMKTAYTL